MGLYLKQNEARSQLSSKVAAELSERLKTRGHEPNSDAESAMLLKNQRKTSSGGLFWTVVSILIIAAVLTYVIFIF